MNKVIISIIIGILTTSTYSFGSIYGAYHHYFAFEMDYVYLRRANSHNRTLVSTAGGPTNFSSSVLPVDCKKSRGTPLITTKHLINHMQFDSGLSGAFKIFMSMSSTWELRYTGGFSWRSQKTRDCIENLDIANRYRENQTYTSKESSTDWVNMTNNYNHATHVKSIYYSNMDTAELNYWHHITPRYIDHFSVSWLAGLRHFDVQERIKLYFTKTYPQTQTSKYRTSVGNNTLGLQLGGILEYNPSPFLTWGLVAKLGGFFNRGYQKTLMLDKDNTYTFRDKNHSGSNFAYMGQFFPFIKLRPSKHFFVNISYQVLYIGNFMTASQNLRFYGSGMVMNRKGHIIYHGLTSGLQFNF